MRVHCVSLLLVTYFKNYKESAYRSQYTFISISEELLVVCVVLLIAHKRV